MYTTGTTEGSIKVISREPTGTPQATDQEIYMLHLFSLRPKKGYKEIYQNSSKFK